MSLLEMFGLKKADKQEQEPAARSFQRDLEKVNALLKEKEEVGLEEIKEITGMDPEEFLSYATGEENIKMEEVADFNDRLRSSLSEEGEYNGSRFKRLMRTQAGRAAFVSLLLFLKFAPHAEAAETKGPETGHEIKTEFEAKKADKIEGGDKTYQFSSYQPETEKAALDMEQGYETDKADIDAPTQEQLKTQLESFLDGITPNNFHELMHNDWKIVGSSDERPTNNWEGGNYALTQARIASAETILKAVIESHDFSSSGLSQEQIKELKDKPFQASIVESSHGPEKGVTYITDLDNPETGKHFTVKEVDSLKKNDPAKYQELLDSCRFIKLELEAEGSKIDPLKPIQPGGLETPLHAHEIEPVKLGNFKDVMILMDNSPSMERAKADMATYLENNFKEGVKVMTGSFSDKLQDFHESQDMKAAAKTMKEMVTGGASSEKIISSTQQALEKFSADKGEDKAGLLLVNTDEALQDLSYNNLMALKAEADKHKVDVRFMLSYIENGQRQVGELELDDLIDQFTKAGGPYEQTKTQLEKFSVAKGLGAKMHNIYKEKLESVNDLNIVMSRVTLSGEGKSIRIESRR